MNAGPNFLGGSAQAAEPEKLPVRDMTNDDKADWLLHKAQHAKGRARLRFMRQAAVRLGELRAERPSEPVLQWSALEEVGRQNGVLIGENRKWRLSKTLKADIESGRCRRAAELAAPHVDAALADVRMHLRLNPKAASNDWPGLLETMRGAADDLAQVTGLPGIEIFRAIADAANLDARQRRAALRPVTHMVMVSRKNLDEKIRRADDLAFNALAKSGLVYQPGPVRALTDPFAKSAQRDRFEITMFGDLDDAPVKEWLIDDMLGGGEFSCFWGMPGCGKSVIVGDAAFHVAAGRPWHGKAVRKGLVVFVAAERADLTKRRFAALRKRYGAREAPLAVIKGRLDLTSSADDARAIIEAVRGLEEKTGEACVWLIVDTIARTFGAGDENKQSDMGAYVQACDLMRDELSAHVSVIHHCSRTGEKPRGSIALDGAVDATFKVQKSGLIHTVAVDKENDAPEGGVIRFRMEGVDLGRDRKGKMTMAPIAVPDTTTIVAFEMTDGTSVSLGSKKGPSRGAKVLHKALEEVGEDHPNGRRAVAVGELRKRLREEFGGPNVRPDSLATMERRELKKLIDKGEVERIGEWLMPPE